MTSLVVDVARNQEIERFGMEATELIEKELARQGFKPYRNPSRTAAADREISATGATSSAAVGYWKHPEMSSVRPEMMEEISGALTKDCVIRATLAGNLDDGEKYLVFTSVDIEDQQDWNACLIWSSSPVVVVRTLVLDRNGQPVLSLKSWGRGEGSLYIANRSADSLRYALKRAFKELEGVEPQAD